MLFNLPSNFRDETLSKTTSMLIRNWWLSFLSRVKYGHRVFYHYDPAKRDFY